MIKLNLIKGQYLIYFSICLLLLNCSTAIDEETIEEFVPDPKVFVHANLRGIVLDVDGSAILGAKIEVEGVEIMTDELGYFSIPSTNLSSTGTIVRIEKSGYFESSRYIVPSLKDNFVKFNLIPKILTGTFNALVGDTIILNDSAKIIIPANILQVRNGNNYTGMVKVYAHFLNPTNEDLTTLMPANLVGQNLQEQQVALACLGMMRIDLHTSTDDILMIKENEMVQVYFPIAEEILSTAPPILPLWSLKIGNNIWKQEGHVNLREDMFRAEIGHSDWWNCAWPYTTINFKGRAFFENDSLPIKDERVSINLANRNWKSTAVFTNEEGFFNTVVPAQSSLKIEIINSENEIVYSNEIGPLTEDYDIGDLYL